MSFRKYGGTNYSSKHNLVNSHVNNSQNLSVGDTIGQENSYINILSNINALGNIDCYGNIVVTDIYALGDIDCSENIKVTNIRASGNMDCSGNLKVTNIHTTDDIDCSGNIRASGDLYANNFSGLSDYRIKENIISLHDDKDKDKFTVDKLRPVHYTHKKTQKESIGLIAHEVQEVFPFLVRGEKDAEKMQSLNYIGLIPVLIKEIQDLKKELSEIKKQINN